MIFCRLADVFSFLKINFFLKILSVKQFGSRGGTTAYHVESLIRNQGRTELTADDSHEISCLICHLCKSGKICNCRLQQIIDGALRVKAKSYTVS